MELNPGTLFCNPSHVPERRAALGKKFFPTFFTVLNQAKEKKSISAENREKARDVVADSISDFTDPLWNDVFDCTNVDCPRPENNKQCLCVPIFKEAGWTGGSFLAFNVPTTSLIKQKKDILKFYFDCSASAGLAVTETKLAICNGEANKQQNDNRDKQSNIDEHATTNKQLLRQIEDQKQEADTLTKSLKTSLWEAASAYAKSAAKDAIAKEQKFVVIEVYVRADCNMLVRIARELGNSIKSPLAFVLISGIDMQKPSSLQLCISGSVPSIPSSFDSLSLDEWLKTSLSEQKTLTIASSDPGPKEKLAPNTCYLRMIQIDYLSSKKAYFCQIGQDERSPSTVKKAIIAKAREFATEKIGIKKA